MTKIKIAAVIVCMVATGAFAGFTYQAANNNGSADENVTVKTFSELTTDDETTSDETVTDEETTSDETTAEEDITVVTTAVTTKKADKKTEKASKKTTKTSAEEKKVEKKAASAPAVTTAPVVEEVPETVTEQYYEEPVYEEVPVYEEPEYVESEPVYEEQPEETSSEEPAPAEDTQEEEQDNDRKIQVTDEEYIWLCNVVGHEYGANWISEYEKAKVVEVVMNRVNDPRFPNTIWGVLTQPNQFSGLEWTLYLGTYSYQVTPSVMAAVDMYLEHPEDFNHGYLGFWGDGSMNHFYSI
ncbi:Cell Wall Hydrolase [Ruminococcus albus]|uniref:Cell Wall Hydrolase n=2 Tax=Ruminococcus albus TaxID=1264 RepID=A0A1H7I6W7_RUMAL|nr:Cell Wall Hydrolase [Ruminococcus albus]